MISYGSSQDPTDIVQPSIQATINNYLLYHCLCKSKYHSTNNVEVLKLDINFYITITDVHVHKKCK